MKVTKKLLKDVDKLNFKVSEEEKEMIDFEIKLFGISKDKFFIKLLEYYTKNKLEKETITTSPITKKSKKEEIIGFNISNFKQKKIIPLILEEHGYNYEKNRSQFLRDMWYTFYNKPFSEKEKIIYAENISIIKEAKLENKKINFTYEKITRTVTVVEVNIDKEKQHIYLLAYDDSIENDFKPFRVSKMKDSCVSLNDAIDFQKDKYLADRLSEIYISGTPFLNIDKKNVKVKFTDKGKILLKDISLNRPKCNSKDLTKNIIDFDCSLKHAEIYFSQIYNEIEILEPLELRNIFKENLEKTLKLYKEEGKINE